MVFEEVDCCLAEGGAFFPPVEGPLAVGGELLEGPAGWLGVEEDNACEDIGDTAAVMDYGFVDPGGDAGGDRDVGGTGVVIVVSFGFGPWVRMVVGGCRGGRRCTRQDLAERSCSAF